MNYKKIKINFFCITVFDESGQNAVIKLPLVVLSSAERIICILGGALNDFPTFLTTYEDTISDATLLLIIWVLPIFSLFPLAI